EAIAKGDEVVAAGGVLGRVTGVGPTYVTIEIDDKVEIKVQRPAIQAVLAKVPLRRGEVDQDFDQEELAKLLDQGPFNMAIADLYRSRFRRIPGVIYT